MDIVDTAVYDAFGKVLGDIDTGTAQAETYQDPVGFGGQFGYYTDAETGLVCLTHRYYDGKTGRFVNRDPIGYKGGINLYGFCANNPVNRKDPNGTDALYICGRNEGGHGAYDPDAWLRHAHIMAAAYEKQTGKKAFVETATNVSQFIAKFNSHKNIDHFEYVGHGGFTNVNDSFLHWHGCLYLGDDTDPTKVEFTNSDVDKLNTSVLTENAKIYLTSCDSGVRFQLFENSITQEFAGHFDTDAYGFIGGANYGVPKSEKLFGRRLDKNRVYGWQIHEGKAEGIF